MAIIQDKQYSSESDEFNDYESDVSDSGGFLTEMPDSERSAPTADDHPRQRANGRRKEEQRQRLLRYLVDALQQGELAGQGRPSSSIARRRPRLVLLGNQKTMILGMVLSDRGATVATEVDTIA
jgi:hypothetical protein